jgi:hypothetical protein
MQPDRINAEQSNPDNKETGATAAVPPLTKKERIINELKEVAITMLYLATSLCILETYKSLILLQQGINAFAQNYTVALVEALMLGKIVVIAQNLPFLKPNNKHSLARAVLYQSVLMTLIIDIGGKLEDTIFPHTARLLAQSGNPQVLMVTHQVAAMSIFIVLFTVTGLDKLLGPGTLWRLVFRPPASR